MNRDLSETSERYVAFCYILGFSSRILGDFEEALGAYQAFGDAMARVPPSEVEVSLYSDAILISGTVLHKVLATVQGVWLFALASDLMLHGGIAKGRYWQQRRENGLMVISDALVRAVKLERTVGIPAVVIADDIDIPDNLWFERFRHGPIMTPVLHFRDRNIVNPFSLMCYRSAADRARGLMAKSPAHRDKYLWFLALYDAVGTQQPLVPQPVLDRFLESGVVVRHNPPAGKGTTAPKA